MINYIEELDPGDAFIYNEEFYVLSADKTSKARICYSLQTGFVRHLNNSTIISKAKLLTLDDNNNIIPIKHDSNETIQNC